MWGSRLTQGLEGEGGGTGREAPSDAADPSSELPFRLQQSFKNGPVLIPSFSHVLCNAAWEKDWTGFTSVGGVWEPVAHWGTNQLLHRYLEVCLATVWQKKTSFIGRLNACVTFFMPYFCCVHGSAAYFTVCYLYFLFTAESRGLICVINVPGTFWWSKVCRYVFNMGVENWVTHRLMEKLHPAVALPPFSERRKWRRQQSCTKNRAAIPFVTDQSILNVNDFLKNCNSVCPVNWAGSFHICFQNNWCVHRAGFSS